MDEDEFGGFEAAELEEETLAQPPPQAAPNPWAFFPGQNQPDLIRPPGQASATPEIRPNPHDPLEPNFRQNAVAHSSLFTDGATGGADPGGASGANISWEADFKKFEPASSDSRSLSEQVLEPHFGATKSDRPVPDGVFDLDLTQRQAPRQVEELDLELEPDIQNVHVANQNAAQSIQIEAVDQSGASRQNGAANEGAGDIREMACVSEADRSAENHALEQQLQASNQEKSALQKEIEDLIKNNHVLEKEIGVLQAELSQQQEQYATVQERHSRDLDEMRRSGQDALAIIVEEYKELCKSCVLEQQVSCQEQLQVAVQREQDKWQELLKVQQEEFEKTLEEEKNKLREEIKESLEQEKQRHQEELGKLVKEEHEKLNLEMQQSVKSMAEEHESLIEEKFTSEGEQWKQHLAEEQEKLQTFMEKEKESNKESLAKAVEEESQRCQECMSQAVGEERDRGVQALKEASVTAQQDLAEAVKQQKQRDLVVKKKSLASIDLFLESARQQLRLLMDTDPLDTGSKDSSVSDRGASNLHNGASCSDDVSNSS